MSWIGRISLLLATAAAVGLGLTFWLVDGEAAAHAREHLTIAIVASLAAAFVAFYDHTRDRTRRLARAVVVLALLYVALVQLGAGIATYGYEADDSTERVGWLADAHELFDDLAVTSYIALGAAALLWVLVVLWQRGTRPRGAMLTR